jgi:hypothetical protein
MIAVLLSAATCQLGGGGAFTLPDDRCTKGEQWAPVTQAQACDPAQHERQPVSATLRRQVLARYGYTPATFHGEIQNLQRPCRTRKTGWKATYSGACAGGHRSP